MTAQETSGRNGVRLCPPPPSDFDPFSATEEDLKRHGLPLRPDPPTEPGRSGPPGFHDHVGFCPYAGEKPT